MNVGFAVPAVVPDMSATTLPPWVPCLPLSDVRDLAEQVSQGRTTEADELFKDEQKEFRHFAALGMKLHGTDPAEPL